jgi:hypothetical protein
MSPEEKASIIRCNQKHRDIKKKWLRDYKAARGCKFCPEKEPCALDFHHRDRLEKTIELAEAVHARWSIPRLLTEIAKCEVVCANCHRKIEAGYVFVNGLWESLT